MCPSFFSTHLFRLFIIFWLRSEILIKKLFHQLKFERASNEKDEKEGEKSDRVKRYEGRRGMGETESE